MFFEVTIVILFIYTVVLIGFFMGWCTLIPNMCHPRREIPFSSVKSPRRNTNFSDLDAISIVSRKASLGNIGHIGTGSKASIGPQPHYKYSVGSISGAYQDLLHPKYSMGSWQFKLMQIEAQQRRDLFCASSSCSFDPKETDYPPSPDEATSSQQSLQPPRPSIA